MEDICAVASHFHLCGDVTAVSEIGDGNINGTWKITCGARNYLLQRINTYVFKDPVGMMRNISLVTDHLRRAYQAMGIDPTGRVLNVINATDGSLLWQDDAGNSWRVYDFIENATAYNKIESPAAFREAARGFGEFARLLSDFPAGELVETIPGFHHTPRRYEAFEAAIAADKAGRVSELGDEIAFLCQRKGMMSSIMAGLEDGSIPLRVTHNDTKINNVMISNATGQAACVIDLDTVMPGSALFDFGDAIRSGAPTLTEESDDFANVKLDMALFEAFAAGYIGELKASLTAKEVSMLAQSAVVITCEQAMRFLTDYIDGDLYYKTRYPGHNLVRARNQMALVSDMENHLSDMQRICDELSK